MADPFGAFGEAVSPVLARAALTDGLGVRLEIAAGYYKPFPACRYAHPAIEAARRVVAGGTVDAASVDAVEVHTYDLAAGLTDRTPGTELAARFSIPHAVAVMLVRGHAGPDDFAAGDGLSDPAVRAVAARTAVTEDPAYTADAPRSRPARVTVRLRDGSVRSAEVARSAGGPDAPWTIDQVVDKFTALAEPRLGRARTRRLTDVVLGRAGQGTPDTPLRDVCALLTPPE